MNTVAPVTRWAWAAGAGTAALLASAWVAATSGPLAPIGALDSERAQAVMRILNQPAKQHQTAIIGVTHDEKIVPTFRLLYNIRHGRTYEEAGAGRALQ